MYNIDTVKERGGFMKYSNNFYGYHSFVSNRTDAEKYAYDYAMHDTWAEIEYSWAEEMGLELEVYED